MLVITHHRPEDGEQFAAAAYQLLEVLGRSGDLQDGSVSRSPDDPGAWVLITRWSDAGSMRRAMSGYDAKVALAPVLASASGGPSVFEPLLTWSAEGTVTATSDRHPAADSAGPGDSSLG